MSSTRTADEPARGGRDPRSLRAPSSLAVRLTLWYTGSAFALILMVTAYLYWALARNLEREDTETLADQIHILEGLLQKDPADLVVLGQEVEVETAARKYKKMYLRILDETGTPIVETPGMSLVLPVSQFSPARDVSGELASGATFRPASGEPYRLLSARVPAGRGHLIIQAALDRGEEEELLAEFRLQAIPVLAVSLVLCALVGHRIARRGIRPVEEISQTARRIRSTTLNERIGLAGLPAEISVLATTFNEMLGRLEESFARLARFSADIAHELRTPINNLRGEVEVALGKPRSTEEYREVMASFLEECERLSRMIDSLLFLARAENPETPIWREQVDLARELQAIREFYEPASAEAGIVLAVEAPETLPVEMDRTLFQRAVGNLVENALAHTPRGGNIRLAASRDDGKIRIEVADTGSGIAPEHLPRVFDRFYRVDRSRTAATGGMGLGLAIVKSIAELHAGTAVIDSKVGCGTLVTLTISDRPRPST